MSRVLKKWEFLDFNNFWRSSDLNILERSTRLWENPSFWGARGTLIDFGRSPSSMRLALPHYSSFLLMDHLNLRVVKISNKHLNWIQLHQSARWLRLDLLVIGNHTEEKAKISVRFNIHRREFNPKCNGIDCWRFQFSLSFCLNELKICF